MPNNGKSVSRRDNGERQHRRMLIVDALKLRSKYDWLSHFIIAVWGSQ
jgi:hypothetical protein